LVKTTPALAARMKRNWNEDKFLGLPVRKQSGIVCVKISVDKFANFRDKIGDKGKFQVTNHGFDGLMVAKKGKKAFKPVIDWIINRKRPETAAALRTKVATISVTKITAFRKY